MNLHLFHRNERERERLAAAAREAFKSSKGLLLPDLVLFVDPDTGDLCVVELRAHEARALANPALSDADRRDLLLDVVGAALADPDYCGVHRSADYGVVH